MPENQKLGFGRQCLPNSIRLKGIAISQSAIDQSQFIENQADTIVQPTVAQWGAPPEKILSHLSFSHITLLLTCGTPLQRALYEIESIKGGWPTANSSK